MMGVTHVAFAVACGTLGGASAGTLPLLALGALLPDIDHPQSVLGRLCFFVSLPLHHRWGHRRHVHSFFLWGALALAGLVWTPALWLGLGALSHVLIDCLNVSGVQGLLPFAEQTCVLFARKWRLHVGSRQELLLMVVFGCVAWAGGYVGASGGVQGLVGVLIRAPRMAQQQFMAAGTQMCFFEGTLRHRDGRLEYGKWLAVGKEGEHGLAVWDEERKQLVHMPTQAEFLRASLTRTGEHWQTMALTGWARTQREAFFYDGKMWREARAGDVVFGWVIARVLEVEAVP